MDSGYIDPTTRQFGAWAINETPAGSEIRFSIFFPDRSIDSDQYEPQPYDETGTRLNVQDYGDPKIVSIHVVGDFQQHLGQTAWIIYPTNAMIRSTNNHGVVWCLQTPFLPNGFYEYQYHVKFQNGEERRLSDPCARYGGHEDRSGIVAGDSPIPHVEEIANGRKPLRDLIIYELNIDDFIFQEWGDEAGLEVVARKIDYLKTLGINTIHFLPWTDWGSERYDWGYSPKSYFSVAKRYTNNRSLRYPASPNKQLSFLRELITKLHREGIHVIMDGVFNHAGGENDLRGFSYRHFYQNREACPYTGRFGEVFPGLRDLDYHNRCTQELIRDACFYWMDYFKIDGIRLDAAKYYYEADARGRGLTQLMADVYSHAEDLNFSLIIEFLDLAAASVTGRTKATGYWHNGQFERSFDALWDGGFDGAYFAMLDSQRGLSSPDAQDKVPVTYISNHDHAHVAWQSGASAHESFTNAGSMRWYRTQPFAIALFTAPGTPLILNGQEFGEDQWMPEDDHGSSRRVISRPLHWEYLHDERIGKKIFWLYRQLIEIRKNFASLRSANIYPLWSEEQTKFNQEGYGFDAQRQMLIYHRFGQGNGGFERFVIALNFKDDPQQVDIPFPLNGIWKNLLAGDKPDYQVVNFHLPNQRVEPHWGMIFFHEG